MKKYRVKVISILVKGNRMAKFGELLDSNLFMSDAVQLEKNGFIEEVVETKKPKK